MSNSFNFFCFEFMVGNGFLSKLGGLSFIIPKKKCPTHFGVQFRAPNAWELWAAVTRVISQLYSVAKFCLMPAASGWRLPLFIEYKKT